MHNGSTEHVTIADVARAARVSPSTVSNLLNGRESRMRPLTRRRVLRAIEELGYRPSRVARQLRTGRAQIIGLIVPSVANPFWGTFARVVESEALRHDRQVLLCNSERAPDREREYVDELWASGVRAIIIGTSLPSLAHLRPAVERGLRLIAFDRERQPDDPPSVVNISVDNRLGARLATEHLLSLGHRRIAFLSGSLGTVSRQQRVIGYRESLDDAGIPFQKELVWEESGVTGHGYGDVESAQLGSQGITALLDLAAPPSAVLAINDMYAIGACAGARERGVQVPGDLSVVGFDDIVLSQLFNPPLTTVRQPLEAMVRAAMAVILEGGSEGESIVIPPDLTVRASTALRADGTHRITEQIGQGR